MNGVKVKKLLKYLKNYKAETVIAPLFKLIEATLELIVPLIVASIIDVGIYGGNGSHVIGMSLVLVLLGAVGLAFSVIAQYYAAKASVGFVSGIKRSLFSHMNTLSYSEVDKLGTSTLITRMTSDATRVQTGLNLALRLLLRSPFVVFGAMIMAFAIDASAGVTFAVTIPALSVVVFGIMLLTMPMYKKVQSGVDRILTKTRENLSGVRVIRAFGREDDEIKAFRADNDELTAGQKKAGGISALMNPLTYVIINLGIIFLIYVGALKVDIGDLTQGEVIALYNYMSQILVELVKLANLIISITKAMASASRIASVFEIKSERKYGSATDFDSEIAINLSSVALKYNEGADPAIEGITFSARRGETVGIIGGTGSGKTSLINLIPRFYDCTDGTVTLFGKPISEYTQDTLTEKIALAPQKAVLFSGTVRDNMLFGNPGATDEEIERALSIAQADGFVSEKGGLSARVEAGGKNFSGGQRQRLSVARALVKNADVLILDDSSSALDYATDAAMRSAIRENLGGKTVFIVSQRTASVMHADKIIVLDDGCAVGIGTHDELLSGCEVYREIYVSQNKASADEEVRENA